MATAAAVQSSGAEALPRKRLESDELVRKLFAPQTVAVVGASDDPMKLSGRVIAHLRRHGYAGKIYPINPNRATVQGLPAYGRIADVPLPVDIAVIAVPAEATVDAVRDCADAGIGVAIVFASGFAETDAEGEARQQALGSICTETGIRVLGPNCLGVIGLGSAFAGTFSTMLERRSLIPGPVAFVSQSGAFGTTIFGFAQSSGLGFSHFASTGNEVDITAQELALGLLEQDDVRALLLYLEAVTDGEGLLKLARRAHELDKPVVTVKVGRSAAGARAATSHTGSLAGQDEIYDSVARQFALIRVDGMDSMLDAARVITSGRRANGNRLTIVTVSGGAGILMADAAANHGLEVSPWAAEWQQQLTGLVPPFGSTANPIDVTAAVSARPGTLGATLDLVARHPETDVIAVMMGGSQSTEQQLLESTQAAFAKTGKPMVVAWSGDDESPRRLTDAGVPTFTDPSRAIAALGCLARWSLRPPLPPDSVTLGGLDGASAAARELCEAARADGRKRLDEFESKRILEAYGLACVSEVTAQTPADAVTAADALGYPVAVKLLASETAHKSELGCVRLGLTDAAGVHAAANDVLGIAASVGVATPRILVQRMAGPGLELLLGVKRDKTFGEIVVAGLGGVLAELLNDVALARAPVDLEQAARMLDSLRGSRVLDGFGGRPASDRVAVVDAIVRLSVLASDLQDEIAEIDVNPLIVGSTGAGAVVVDALVVLS